MSWHGQLLVLVAVWCGFRCFFLPSEKYVFINVVMFCLCFSKEQATQRNLIMWVWLSFYYCYWRRAAIRAAVWKEIHVISFIQVDDKVWRIKLCFHSFTCTVGTHSHKKWKLTHCSKKEKTKTLTCDGKLQCHRDFSLIFLLSLQVMNFMNKLAGNEYVGFSNATWVKLNISEYLNKSITSSLKWAAVLYLYTSVWVSLNMSFSLSSVSQFPVWARVWRQKLCHRLLPEGEEGKVRGRLQLGAEVEHYLTWRLSQSLLYFCI